MALFVFLILFFLIVLKWLFRWGSQDIIATGILIAAILVLVLLKQRYKAIGWAMERGFQLYLKLVIWYFIIFGPIVIFYQLTPLILNKLTTVGQVLAFVFWGLLLVSASAAVLIEKYRERFLTGLQKRVGKIAPVGFAFNLLVIAILFFSSVTYVLVTHGSLRLTNPTRANISPEILRDFFAWHFLEAIPLLKINSTLRWQQPLTYDAGSVGSILLLFQLMIIIPVIRAIGWYWKNVGVLGVRGTATHAQSTFGCMVCHGVACSKASATRNGEASS